MRVQEELVASPAVTIKIIYYGNPQAIVVFTADKGGAPTLGYVVSSVPRLIPGELSAMVDAALPKKKTVERLVVKALNDKTAQLDESGVFSKATGPHRWSLVLPRYPLADKLVVVVLDVDGTIRRSGGVMPCPVNMQRAV